METHIQHDWSLHELLLEEHDALACAMARGRLLCKSLAREDLPALSLPDLE